MTKFEVKLLIKLLEEKQGRTDDRIAKYKRMKKEVLSVDERYNYGFAGGEYSAYCVVLNLLREYVKELEKDWKLTYGPGYTDREKEAWEVNKEALRRG